MKYYKHPLFTILLSILFIFQSIGSTAFAFDTKIAENSTQISPGVTYVEETYNGNSYQSVRLLNIDLNDPFTELEVGIPNPLNATAKVSDQALQNHYEGHFVVGATNGGFFDTVQKLPVNLIAKENKLINIGVTGKSTSSPTNAPIAFGINKDGKAIIERYHLNMEVNINGDLYNLTKINGERPEHSIVLYNKPNEQTGTNEWGTEIIVENASPSPTELWLDQPVTGTVSKITRFGEGGNATVPSGGFVISVHGKDLSDKLIDLEEGDVVSYTLSLGEAWEDAQYVLGTGPQLIEDGKVSISMDENESFAKERHPRTAIATNEAGDRVFIVTVDGRQSGYSNGATLRELANYLLSIGAYQAINLDGGGSTTMVVRQLGEENPVLVNKPSDGVERKVSTTFQVISTAPVSAPKTLKLSLPAEKILKGTEVDLELQYALDEYMNPVQVDVEDLHFEVEGDIGSVEDSTFVAEHSGTGKIVATLDEAYGEVPLTVIDTVERIEIEPQSIVIGTDESIQLNAELIFDDGESVLYDKSLIKWAVEGEIGTITPEGKFTAGSEQAEGNILATYEDFTASIPVKVGVEPVLIDGFESLANWSADQARAIATIELATDNENVKEGTNALKLSYDFTTEEEGIKAAYAVANTPISLKGYPKELGLWVKGDGANHWLRAQITDGSGNTHTINFTEEHELNWEGWRYVRAEIPANLPLPLTFDRIYVAEAVKDYQNKGAIYFDQLQAAYESNHPAPVSFKDIDSTHWAYSSVIFLANRGIIKGYEDGTFRPNTEITRAMAAAMLARELQLTPSTDGQMPFTDVEDTHYAYNAIQAVAEAGIIKGKEEGKFAPDEPLTRAQMAVILNRAYHLEGESDQTFTDVAADHWAANDISTLAANHITSGYEDGSFKPSKPTTRAEFSAFMQRVILQMEQEAETE